MDAAPALVEIADALASAKLEAILIGNAGAALQGAPGTTVDVDFFYPTSKADPQSPQSMLRVFDNVPNSGH